MINELRTMGETQYLMTAFADSATGENIQAEPYEGYQYVGTYITDELEAWMKWNSATGETDSGITDPVDASKYTWIAAEVDPEAEIKDVPENQDEDVTEETINDTVRNATLYADEYLTSHDEETQTDVISGGEYITVMRFPYPLNGVIAESHEPTIKARGVELTRNTDAEDYAIEQDNIWAAKSILEDGEYAWFHDVKDPEFFYDDNSGDVIVLGQLPEPPDTLKEWITIEYVVDNNGTSMQVGNNCEAASSSGAVGNHVKAKGHGQFVCGRYNEFGRYDEWGDFEGTDPREVLFAVGNGTNNEPANAMLVTTKNRIVLGGRQILTGITRNGYAASSRSIANGTSWRDVTAEGYTLSAGFYFVEYVVAWASNATGRRALRLMLESTGEDLGYTWYDIRPAVNGTITTTRIVGCIYISNEMEEDTIYPQVYQNSGGSLTAYFRRTITRLY